MDCRVTCISKPDPRSSHERITHVGNPISGWKWPVVDVIRSIEGGTNTFFVLDNATGKRSDVGVVYPSNGHSAYIRTHADGFWNDNLLALDQCPIA